MTKNLKGAPAARFGMSAVEAEEARRAQHAAEQGDNAGVKVVARPATFRRAGRVFTADPKTFLLSDLTVGELEDLRSEKNLVVVDVTVEPAGDAPAGREAPKE